MRKISFIICAILCLCVTAANARTAVGRYVENQIKLPFEGNLSFACAGGTVYCADAKGDTLFYSADLDNWEATALSREGRGSGLNGIAVASDGTIYLSSGWAWLNEYGHPYIERVKDGESSVVQLDQTLDTGTDRLVLCALPRGETLGLSDTEAYRFSAGGATLQRYAVSGGEAMAVYGREFAVCQTGEGVISVFDIESGRLLRQLALPAGVAYGLSRIAYDSKGALYYVGPGGLYQSNAGGFMTTRIADGRLMTVGKPSVEARALLFDQEDNPAIAYSQGESAALIAYRYDENALTEPGVSLSVFSLYDSQTLRECANQFQIIYPEAIVDITTPPKGTAATRDDFVRALNTRLLAGKGPDVLVLDGLPLKSYIEKGVLADIAGAVRPMIEAGELLENVACAFAEDGAVYAVPTRFLLPSIWGGVEGIHTLDDMARWAKANPDSLAYYAIDARALIGTFYPSCAPAWFRENGRLDEAAIEAFLTALKEIRGKTASFFTSRFGRRDLPQRSDGCQC